ncbi:helix-turn-helix domain-containing protein [Xylocopilactobacillus apicola]|uniref:HTH cro/C1-type domain-containing protein n=1 Tax=Xylocopilactobacillus apicola TaxID=2932184 RepID=A0AAU9D868_9LACO|nr:Rgg/GadR/MutR family transcriptional regulator [Xylocopilactobacillus apicola]BDR57655.1 hypothetical protein XA3_00960 [Xylocopilactobacillus apicola]
MPTIGDLLKKYRILQTKTQKEWAEDVISTSYYSKVEKDMHHISAEDLIRILKKNNVSVLDFFSELDYKSKYVYDAKQALKQQIVEAYYDNNVDELIKVRLKIDKSNESYKNDYLLFIDGLISVMNNSLDSFGKEKVDSVKELIFSISDMDKAGLILYCNFMPFYDLDDNIIISKRAIERNINSYDPKVQEILLAIIANILNLSIEKCEEDDCFYFIEASHKIPSKPALLFYKTSIYVYENLVTFHKINDPIHLKNCKSAAQSFKFMGMDNYSEKIIKFISEKSYLTKKF